MIIFIRTINTNIVIASTFLHFIFTKQFFFYIFWSEFSEGKEIEKARKKEKKTLLRERDRQRQRQRQRQNRDRDSDRDRDRDRDRE